MVINLLSTLISKPLVLAEFKFSKSTRGSVEKASKQNDSNVAFKKNRLNAFLRQFTAQ
jgi:hypothetical protein